MTSLLFLIYFAAMLAAIAGRRPASLAIFAVALAASVAWLMHHMTDPLGIAL